jgi:hypothetical protein
MYGRISTAQFGPNGFCIRRLLSWLRVAYGTCEAGGNFL